MGSLADELEKVKVGLPRSKTVSISRALSHPQGAGTLASGRAGPSLRPHQENGGSWM